MNPRWRQILACIAAMAVLAACSDTLDGTGAANDDDAAARDANPSKAEESAGADSANESANESDAAVPAQIPAEDQHVGRREARSMQPPQPIPTQQLGEVRNQQLDWTGCGDRECSTLTVPDDYRDPDGGTLQLQVERIAAEAPVGTMLIDVGTADDPETFVDVTESFGRTVRDQYDMMWLDRRGVDGPSALTCLDEMDVLDLLDLADDHNDARDEAVGQIADDCNVSDQNEVRYLDAFSAARDVEVLRDVLDAPRMSFYARGAGSFRAASFTHLYPGVVDRAVFDGSLNPALSGHEVPIEQANAHQAALERFAAACVDDGDCRFGDDVEDAVAGMHVHLEAVLDDGEALDDELAQVLPLATIDTDMQLRDWARSCLDRPATEPHEWDDLHDELTASASWGRMLAARELLCEALASGYDSPLPRSMESPGTGPLLVIQHDNDPVTPGKWAQRYAAHLLSGVWMTFEGEGHGAYGRSACVTDAVDRYFTDGLAPRLGMACTPD